MSQKKKISQQAKWLALLVSASDRRSVSNLKIQQTAATLTGLAAPYLYLETGCFNNIFSTFRKR
ncbi:hypothetical protein [Microcoleus sp. herbarium5]|uniref:hypothetical protein n=1 Tax=Microcoleus sp. herbarium5 TaxID=3055434 RepID=UPI002FD4E895